MSLTRVLADARGGRERVYVLGVVLLLLSCLPLASASQPDPLWIVGSCDGGDFDDVVSVLTDAETVGPLARLTGTAPLLLVSVSLGFSVSAVLAAAISTARPRSPPRI